jgi:crotonobetainyl-CoA:carnitine CoA-transferase CaiB-like acyl-CoA transferase
MIEPIIATQPRAHWAEKLDRAGLIWSSVATITDVMSNPQVRDMGWIKELEHPEYGKFETLDTPFRIYGSDVGARGPAPSPGADTFAVLTEMGVSEARLGELAEQGVLG